MKFIYSEEVQAALSAEHVRGYIVSKLNFPMVRDIAACVRKACVFVVGHGTPYTRRMYFRT